MAAKPRDDDDDDDKKEKDDRNDRDRREEKKYVPKMPDRKYGFFRDDQLTFLVTHKQDRISEEELGAFRQAIAPTLENVGVGIQELEAISFPRREDKVYKRSLAFLSKEEVKTTERPFSIIKCVLEHAPDDPLGLLDIVEKLNEQKKKDPYAGITLEGISLNWLTSVTAQGSGTGGPGGKPSPYTGSRKNAPYCFDLQQQLEKARGGTLYGDGSGVDVIILDTAPSAQALISAYKEWPDHPLISTLLGPQGKLRLYPAPYEECLRLTATSLNDHDYKMTDHGLFIAGIIHSIVPKADIHLIEVLNQYGVGDVMSFSRGLETARKILVDRNRKAVINCSWMLDSPLDARHCRLTTCTDELDAAFIRRVLKFSLNDKVASRMLDQLFNEFFIWGKQAIAAAGNDGKQGEDPRVPARNPAALKSVTGVGALPKSLVQTGRGKNNYIPTDFSDLSDGPDSRGVVTRGIVTLGGEEGDGKGVLGLYIGEFPSCCRNDSKWAWWAGTSFATPIVTAAVASVLSRENNRVNTTQEAIDRLYRPGARIIKQGRAGKSENALLVRQG